MGQRRIDRLKLRALRNNSAVCVSRKDGGPYLVTFGEKAWLLWTSSSRWVEVDPDDGENRLGEMHYGPIAVFYQKHISQKKSLPKNHGKLWVEKDIESLYELIGEDEPIEEIAERMGRSVSSILAKTGALLGYDFSHLNTSRGINDLTISKLIGKAQTLEDGDEEHGCEKESTMLIDI